MTAEQFVYYINNISDSIIDEAIKSGRQKNRKKRIVIAASICTILLLCTVKVISNYTDIGQNIDSTAPPCVHYNNDTYIYHGKIVYELPESATYISETTYKTHFPLENNYESNREGRIYLDKSSSDIVYFQWKEWNEIEYGREPYLIMEIAKED